VYLYVGKHSRNLAFSPLAVNFHLDVAKGLALLFEQVDDVDAAATAQCNEYQLHRPHGLLMAANGDGPVGISFLARFINSFKLIGIVYAAEGNFHILRISVICKGKDLQLKKLPPLGHSAKLRQKVAHIPQNSYFADCQNQTAMRILALAVFLLFGIYVIGARWYYVCELRGLCGAQPADTAVDVRARTLQLLREDSILLTGYEEFAFDSAMAMPRLNADNRAFLDTLAAIMKADTAVMLEITGWFRPAEAAITSVGLFENLGVARADAVRHLLLQREVAESRIFLDYARSDDPKLGRPLNFELFLPRRSPSEYENVAFTFTNMTFSDANFEFDSDVFRPGDPFKLYADSLKTYLATYDEKMLTIIGHTDDIGEARYNQDLGLRRAKNTRKYLKDLGIRVDIEVNSMGETKPVDSNATPEGRQKNRRVNFIIE